MLGETEDEVLLKILSQKTKNPKKLLAESFIKKKESPNYRILARAGKLFQLYLAGKEVDFSSLPLTLEVSPFVLRVLNLVKTIPYGEIRTYRWVAEKIQTKGYRAVGRALGLNPFPVIIPCHRVISSDGTLGGFSSGISLKRKLLTLEKVDIKYPCLLERREYN
ncbi:methylated-DNA--[protein]-cysteine S-methyltransferase [Candidatus Aerophobetes bacterium]|nr:methylated-DNA--[protein]-cysteine S-methyltransferase [Candidatus Aerophobetes bacterium]